MASVCCTVITFTVSTGWSSWIARLREAFSTRNITVLFYAGFPKQKIQREREFCYKRF